jgi:glycosyltransferase involved in cell wall biosynthesis
MHTKNDLVRLYAVAPDKIDVIHHGVSNALIYRGGSSPSRVPERFILVVGGRRGYKNFQGIGAPMANILRANPGLHLLCVGGGALTVDEIPVFEDRGCADRVIQLDLTDTELAWAYAHATAFVFPSLYEGFGIPILEAFANGCPAVLSNRSCFPEVADEAALYFDPDTPSQLETILMQVIGDRQLRRKLIDRAQLRLRDFSWASSAEAHMQCYGRAAGG